MKVKGRRNWKRGALGAKIAVMAMKKKNEGKKKIDASRVGKLRYTIIILIALIAVAAKAVFVVPIENKRIDGTSCDE